MTIIRRPTGLRQSTDALRARVTPYGKALALPRRTTLTYPILQNLARVLDQLILPACVGTTACACGEAVYGIPPHLSWVRLWADARLRDGDLHDPELGTWFSSAIESIMVRGFDREEPGEWDRLEEMTEPDDLDSEMDAHDRRQPNTEHWRAPDGDLDAIDDALARGLGVGVGTGVRDPYLEFFSRARDPSEPDVLLNTSALGSFSNGHEQRVLGVDKVGGLRHYFIQNSWGLRGGVHLPNGIFQLGLARVSETVMLTAWDVDVLLIKPNYGPSSQ